MDANLTALEQKLAKILQQAAEPFGTILGVFTIVVLMRESMRELFGVEPSGTNVEA